MTLHEELAQLLKAPDCLAIQISKSEAMQLIKEYEQLKQQTKEEYGRDTGI